MDLTWEKVISILSNISGGLMYIHSHNYHHKHLHNGNILNSIYGSLIDPKISDFQMSQPVDEKSLYGEIPFSSRSFMGRGVH